MKKNYFTPLEKGVLYIVAVSGGPDSTFLLYKMHSLGYRLVVAHLNYRKRIDSFHDEELVARHCRKLSIRLFIARVSNYRGGNFQAVARNLRYNFFSRIARRLSHRGLRIGGVVIAHNFEDSLETYQLQKERGSLVNYWGLPFQLQFGRLSVFRPVISFRRELIIKLLTEKGIKYSVDYTNDTEVYRRNVVRKKIFALSEKEKNLLSRQIKKENVFLLQNTKEVNRKIRVLFTRNTLDIGNDEWLLSEFGIRQRIIYTLLSLLLENELFSRKKKVVAEICKQLQSRKEKFTMNIGNKWMITKLGKVATFEKRESLLGRKLFAGEVAM